MWLCRTRARSPTEESRPPACSASRPPQAGLPLVTRAANGDEVAGPVQIRLALRPKGEVRGGDRRREAVVERLRQPQRLVDALPARLERQLVDAELAGVEQRVQLDGPEMRLEQLAVLGGGVLAHVTGVLRLL